MLDMIYAIPDNIGWTIVGAVGMLCLVAMVKLGKILIEMKREREE